jgi:hypothetical protein
VGVPTSETTPARPVTRDRIRRDKTGWRVINGLGVVIKDGFDSNGAAWQWVSQQQDANPARF